MEKVLSDGTCTLLMEKVYTISCKEYDETVSGSYMVTITLKESASKTETTTVISFCVKFMVQLTCLCLPGAYLKTEVI